MSLEKLTIKYEERRKGWFTGLIRALFNPTSLSFSRSVNWKSEVPATSATDSEYQKLRFESTALETLNVTLFFDTYEGDPAAFLPAFSGIPSPFGANLFAQPNAVSVLKYTDAVAKLTRFDRELHRPPICQLRWGQGLGFKGVLTSLKQDFSLFLEDGTPVRASVDCTFMQYQSEDDRILNELHSADVAKRYTVLPGDTLSSIAAAVYQDPSQWRAIAAANGIENPRRLSPGQVLAIPKLR